LQSKTRFQNKNTFFTVNSQKIDDIKDCLPKIEGSPNKFKSDEESSP